jgi:uncharacterized protein (DUF1800 family)
LSITPEEAARFLLHAQFSASDEEVAAVQDMGCAAWLAREMDRPTSAGGCEWLDQRGYSAMDGHAYFDQDYPATYMLWQQLITSPDGVRRRLALALSEFFVVSIHGLDFNWRSHALAAYWDLLCRGAFGTYRQLLQEVTLSPAMGYYLNTKGNQKADRQSGRQPDENYAREVLQLFSMGLYQLNIDGTEKADATGRKIETYQQSDISQLAQVFTGYEFDHSRTGQVKVKLPAGWRTVESNTWAVRLPMTLKADKHATDSVNFLGARIAANTPADLALTQALDVIANHPNVAPFFSRQMIQRLTTSHPSPAYVARVARVFNDNGRGVRGDLRSVFAAILLDTEARDSRAATRPSWGKLREPMVRLVQWARTFGLRSEAGSWKIEDTSSAATHLGQSPMAAPSVFNFFRPGFVPAGAALASAGTTAPEFQLVNESSVGGYLNFLRGFAFNGFYARTPDQPFNAGDQYVQDMRPFYANELPLVTDVDALIRRLNLLLCAGQLSDKTQTVIRAALLAARVSARSSEYSQRLRVITAVVLVMASADYLVQK